LLSPAWKRGPRWFARCRRALVAHPPPLAATRPDLGSPVLPARPLFRPLDRNSMLFAFDLWKEADLLKHGEQILLRLLAGTMPVERPTLLLTADHGPFWRTSTLPPETTNHKRPAHAGPISPASRLISTGERPGRRTAREANAPAADTSGILFLTLRPRILRRVT
jgi:hypothetical protein